jgi:hypothetical protein
MNTDKLAGVFMVGWFVGMVTFLILFLMATSETPPPEIHTNKRLQPEKKLTTDGKTVDTLFIYKQ